VRHSYATAALAAGIPAKVVSERLGHATIAITLDTYSHVIAGMDAQAANAVASLILGDPHPRERPGPNRPRETRGTPRCPAAPAVAKPSSRRPSSRSACPPRIV
jgi:hypothetical protein